MQPLAAPAPELEALLPVLKGELPLFVIANRRSDIETALHTGRKFNLKPVIWGGAERWQMAPELAGAKVPVLLEPLTTCPGSTRSMLGWTTRRCSGRRASGRCGQRDAALFRDLGQPAGKEVRNGMSWDDALRSVTLSTARARGMADRYGSLEAGKVANVVVWSGDPLEFSSRADHVFIRGETSR